MHFCIVSVKVLNRYEKRIDADIYSTVKHVAKGLNLKKLTMPYEINQMINLENYVHKVQL